ncbi:MAG: hypothetical protein M3R35_01715 [Candidatus Eremiobacteraeota bacterium]|nr:hypothetical protein [Candidatus Eremiobacteraeota bacterium]
MTRWLAPFILGVIFAWGPVPAAARPVVTLHLAGTLLEQHNGRMTQRTIEGLVLKPGDRVRYIISANNSGTSPAIALVPLGPIPKATSYVLGSAHGSGAAQFTLDGKTWAAKPELSVKTASGIVKRPADPSLYRAVRWIARRSLAPHKNAVFSYDVRVNGHRA